MLQQRSCACTCRVGFAWANKGRRGQPPRQAPELAAGQQRLREIDEQGVCAVGHGQAGQAVRRARARRQRGSIQVGRGERDLHQQQSCDSHNSLNRCLRRLPGLTPPTSRPSCSFYLSAFTIRLAAS